MKTLHLRSILSKSMRCTKNRNACIQHWPTERAQTSTKMSDHRLHNQCFKAEWIGLRSFASSAIFTWPFTTNHHFFKHLNNFLQGKHFQHQQEAENAFQEFVESQSMDFYITGINQPIFQNYVDYNGSYFLNNLIGSQYKKNNRSNLTERMTRFIILEVL